MMGMPVLGALPPEAAAPDPDEAGCFPEEDDGGGAPLDLLLLPPGGGARCPPLLLPPPPACLLPLLGAEDDPGAGALRCDEEPGGAPDGRADEEGAPLLLCGLECEADCARGRGRAGG